MAKNKFFPWLKPDNKQRLVKPSVSVASYVVDQWRKAAYAGIAFGVVGLGFGGVSLAWAFAKERMPSYTITPIIQPNGWMVKTYVNGENEPLDERIVCSVLQQTFYMLRTVAGSHGGVKANLEIATKNFADAAAVRARRELDALEWYEPLLRQRQTREVDPKMNCYRLANGTDGYIIEWKERLHNVMGPIRDGERNRTISVRTAKLDKAPDTMVNWNPWGVFITEYSGVLD